MDDRFPKILRKLSTKLDFIAIPNLGLLIAGLAVLAFVAQLTMNVSLERFVLDPYLVTQGEWWRLFAFPVENSHPLWFIFYVMLIYVVFNAIEAEWGAGPLTLYVGTAYVAAVAAAFVIGRPVSVWSHVLTNTTLAFATLFPNFEFLLFLILPVKVKWIAYVMGAFLALQFIGGSLDTKIMLVMVMLPYAIFFGPFLAKNIKQMIRGAKNRKRFDKDIWK